MLRRLRAINGHTFWTDEVSAATERPGPFGRVVGYRKLWDMCLWDEEAGSLADRPGVD